MQKLAPRIKRFLPRSLFGRALLILVLPVVLLQGFVTSIFIARHYDGVTVQMTEDVARKLDYIVAVIDGAPGREEAMREVREAGPALGLMLELDPEGRVEPLAFRDFYDLTGSVIAETLKAGVTKPMTLDLVAVPKAAVAEILTTKGVLTATIPRRQLSPANPHQLIVLTNIAGLALVIVAVIFLRNQVRPIRELAEAAVAFGRGASRPFRPAGAEEVRGAGHAFLEMRSRIERQMQSRTAMLSGVSHDLRTPLTRMKLALAMMEDNEEAAEVQQDIGEMERMLDSFLAFARGEAGEQPEPIDVRALAEEIVAGAERLSQDITLSTEAEGIETAVVTARRQALKRAVMNLVDNARTYGGQTLLTLRLAPRSVDFVVEDDGPGIPPTRREEMTRPFTRLDPGRGQSKGGGVGLGLSIALDVARSHGGALELDQSRRLGGLRATLRLPRSPAPAQGAIA
ncbi:MAG: ATP-binding protein [Pseudomonadota bacterium]